MPFKTMVLLMALLLVLVHTEAASSRQSATPARLLAQQTGATQFEEERYETHADCTDHKHSLRKRSSDEDIDYEVYQGVVGRPGIDFPIYPRIPKTSFSCRSFGNGYFADMDTDCQVFHICEEGRKISFLCPNGTIFHQSELTCDWWFKVDCLGSPGYYAESSEILTKQRLQRVRPSVPVQGFNIVGGGLNIKPKINNGNSKRNGGDNVVPSQRSRQANVENEGKSERRMDSIEQHSLETVDFDDLSAEKQIKGQQKVISNIDDNNNNGNDNDESQITAESASFVGGNRRSGYSYDKGNNGGDSSRKSGEGRNSVISGRRGGNGNGNGNGGSQRGVNLLAQGKPFSNDSSDKVRPTVRGGQQRSRDEKRPTSQRGGVNGNSQAEGNGNGQSRDTKKAVLPEKITEPIVVSAEIKETKPRTTSFSITTETLAPSRGTERAATPTSNGSYSTARRLDSTRTTPFYTPTVPSVSKSKTTESKTYYIKSNKGGNVSGVVTTPNPNRLNAGTGSSLFLESSVASKGTTSPSLLTGATGKTTLRPFVIGMRHDYDTSSELHRISVSPNNALNINGVTPKSQTEKTIFNTFATTTARPATTGPTYLPKDSSKPRSISNSAGDELLFAPAPTVEESVVRNVGEMLKTMNLLKDNIDDVEEIKYPGPAREGLDIPPSSGPDVLVSLAKYFAGEEANAKKNSLNALEKSAAQKTPKLSVPTPIRDAQIHSVPAPTLPLGSKPSDTTTSLTTPANIDVQIKSDDLKAGLLREQTVKQYTNLFGLKDPKARQQVTDPSEGLLSHVNESATASSRDISSPFPQIGSTDSTIRKIAEKPESRKIAQVFSNALTTYLEDPNSFREQLASARPTEPPIGVKPNFVPITTTDSSLFNGGTGATYLPSKPTAPTRTTTTARSSIAAEINNKFDYTTRTPSAAYISTTEGNEVTTFKTNRGSANSKLRLELSAELAPPSPDSGEGDEFLQREQTQSFVKSRNNLASDDDTAKKSQQKGSHSSFNKPTENPWVHISQTDFLDPLTINDGLMRESTTTTPSPFTYLPKKTTTALPLSTTGRPIYTTIPTAPSPTTSSRSNLRAQSSLPFEERRSNSYVGSAEVTTKRVTSRLRGIDESGIFGGNGNTWQDIFETYDIPRETLPSSSGLQRIANKLFGGLNETEALHLKNVMLQAEHNRQVLSLLLLLIQTCDDQNGKALERSRKHLLNALIDMDGKVGQGKTSYERGTSATTTRLPPVTTFRRNTEEILASTTPYSAWTTTTELPFSTTTTNGGLEDTTRFEIRVADLDEEASNTTPTSVLSSSRVAGANSSDKRALELLKSLYSLASKFSSRR